MATDPISLATPVRLMRRMAHDMRNPIATLTGTSEMLATGVYGELTPKQTRAAERLRRTSYRLLALLDDLMTYVKAEAGEFLLTVKPFDPRTILADSSERVQPIAAKKEITLHLLTKETVPAKLVGDETAISRIILALMWNAVSFTSHGDVWIESDWLPTNNWHVSIRDSGAGISPEDLPHIFEPFWRGQERPQVPTSGAGLGLALALALAKLMQGNLFIKETGPQGSIFVLHLPLNTPVSLEAENLKS